MDSFVHLLQNQALQSPRIGWDAETLSYLTMDSPDALHWGQDFSAVTHHTNENVRISVLGICDEREVGC